MDYHPIDCNYYDELVLIAMRKREVTIVYQAAEQKITTLQSVIRDIYTKDKEEFILTETGLPIRLDKLISVDGKAVVKGCSI
ncbi:MAG: hypothetical protein AB8G22_29635 [Saprospiraceae bacterium]